jgi:hypothetical protein
LRDKGDAKSRHGRRVEPSDQLLISRAHPSFFHCAVAIDSMQVE